MTSILPNLCPSTGLAKFNDVHEVEHSSDSLLLMHPFMNEITEQGIANGDAADLVSAVAAKALAGETEAAVEQRQLDQRPAKRQKTSAGPTDPNEPAKFRPYQAEKWQERFEELKEFTQVHGHCLVPHTYPEHPELARWVKRQRYQYGLLNQGKKSSISPDRIKILDELGFVWDSHEQNWRERLHELLEYKEKYGSCAVPSSYPSNSKLSKWVKCQRRQYKLYWEGKSSNMTTERIMELNKHEFQWNIRVRDPSKKKNTTKTTENCSDKFAPLKKTTNVAEIESALTEMLSADKQFEILMEVLDDGASNTTIAFDELNSSIQQLENINVDTQNTNEKDYNLFMGILDDLEDDDIRD
mmetsp:Transcript_25955/g.38348  ORF Transcript_25955/g.38348 Transcript_25955/m.38348 type:complete len:356 (-) Transcript_25955:73-1140(-)|eukprot:CAMPEP_0194237406 /NCGR_PEP_ID=MMETSP0158-20130606/4426_1 /TAXON_ID=33649 /ORGANISM="Thalassionema nitzschioides, Strain L26-B" /LENGTH=355 /DNA_ID=CAMNT_0038971433 /DNA_START=11 /DNA_END=1078 /DNA_ORIENTATION=-